VRARGVVATMLEHMRLTLQGAKKKAASEPPYKGNDINKNWCAGGNPILQLTNCFD
jgi:hypothetical protein